MKHLYRLFTKQSTLKSDLVATYAVKYKTPEQVKTENTPENQWLRVNRKWELVR